VLEFNFLNSWPLKVLETDRSLNMLEKSLDVTNRLWKLHMKMTCILSDGELYLPYLQITTAKD